MKMDDWYTSRNRGGIELITTMIESALVRIQSSAVDNMKNKMSAELFRREFGSMHINMGRQFGHSTAAALMLYAHTSTLVFVRFVNDKTRMRNIINDFSFLSFKQREDMNDRIFIADYVGLQKIRGLIKHIPLVVIFDRASGIDTDYKQNVILRYLPDTDLVVELQ